MTAALVQARVLVLNKSYMPIQVTSLKRAFCMIYAGIARVVDKEYQTFDFHSWSELALAVGEPGIGIVGKVIRVPRVVLLQVYDRLPKKQVRFSRYNIFARDRGICQYCSRRFRKSELNLDHVVPRSRGGQTTWENVVCSCVACNRRKGGSTPDEAGMHLVRRPAKPHWTECLNISLKDGHYLEWVPFLNIVDFSYWNVELER
ncbi:MAG TPA: HNH endonuclease [Bdellovibrionota bacterium]|nr:HNH endonuclease [Bdellovibrionota bacterium]